MQRKSLLTVLTVFSLVCLWGLTGLFPVSSQTNTLSEGFEAGGKTAYAADNVNLGSGSWYLDDALTGNTTSDRRTGDYSARIRNTGKVRMNFDVVSAGTVTIQHAIYGTDGTSTWELWKSTDGGAMWTKVGSTITTASTTLAAASFTVNSATAIRFEIRKITGGANRLNLDNIIVAPFTNTTPTPTPQMCNQIVTVTLDESLFSADVDFFAVTTGANSVTVDHSNNGTGLQTYTVVNATNATVNIPSFTPGTYAPVTATFTVTNPSQGYDITLRATNQFHGIIIRVQCGSVTPTPTPSSTPTPTPTPPSSSNIHLTMGNPSNAVTDVNQPTNYLMEKAQYVLSYHRDNGTPNWTSWHLDSTWLGSTPRQDDYRPDTTLPSSWYRVTSNDYSDPNYDRGHMTPSGDRTRTVADNSATFLMTNMIPQAPVNNQTTWANLENYCRTLANAGNELYIISGGYGVSGYIANGRVAVPTYTWKVVMVLPSGTNDVSRVTTSTRLIAIFVPNNNSVVSDWRQYRVSVDSIESTTGYDFYSNVADSIENTIESTIDTQQVIEEDKLDDY